jgi:hypothetical protein
MARTVRRDLVTDEAEAKVTPDKEGKIAPLLT